MGDTKHRFKSDGPGVTGSDSCQICGKWYYEHAEFGAIVEEEPADALTAAESTVASLRAEVERLTKALEPFGRENDIVEAWPDDTVLFVMNGDIIVAHATVGDFRTAARALDRSPSVESGNG